MHCRLKFDIDWPTLAWAALGPPVSSARVADELSYLRSVFASEHLVFGLSVRTIFDALLAELALPPNSPILMTGINIQNMADIAAVHGLRLVAVDVDPATLAPRPGALLEAQAATGAGICLFTQLFGAVNDIDDAAVLRDRGVLIIEDAAQAFAGTSNRRHTGADISLFSFGPIKRRTALGGALGVFSDNSLTTRIASRLAGYPARSNAWFRTRALKYLILKGASTPVIYRILFRAIAAAGRDPDKVIGEAARGFSGSSITQAIRHRPPSRMLALLARQIRDTPEAHSRTDICRAFLAGLPGHAVGSAAQGNSYWILPVSVSEPQQVISGLRARGFDATQGSTSLRVLAPSETPSARTLIENVIYLPHPAALSVSAREEMRAALFAALHLPGKKTRVER